MVARIAKIRLQALVVSAVPLLFLLLLAILSALLVHHAQGVSAASNDTTRMLIQADAFSTFLGNVGRSVTAYSDHPGARELRAYRRYAAAVPQKNRALLLVSAREPTEVPYARRFIAATQAVMVIVDRYVDLVRRGEIARAHAYAQSPAVMRLSRSLERAQARYSAHARSLAIARFTAFSRDLNVLLAIILAVCLCGLAATVLAMRAFGVRIVRRLELLAENAQRLGSGDSVQAVGGEDEIASIDSRYRETAKRLRVALQQKEEALLAYDREHRLASTLQQALLPQDIPTIPGLLIDAAYRSATGDEIGGDWYDVFEISRRLVAFGVGDVAGHDLQAATVMGAVRQAFRVAAHGGADPAAVLSAVNAIVCSQLRGRMVTAFFGVLDRSDGTLRYAIAGHPSPLLVGPERDVRSLDGGGLALGISSRVEYRTSSTHLHVGNAIVLYTDGLVETERDYEKGMESLTAAIREEFSDASGNVAARIQERALGGLEPHDDCALLFIGVSQIGDVTRARPGATWQLDAKNEVQAHRVRRALLWRLEEAMPTTCDLAACEVIVGELISNVVRHTPGRAEITLEWDERGAILAVSDRGDAFALRDGPPDPLAEGGRGLWLVRTLARHFELARAADGNRVRVLLPEAVALSVPVPVG
ncbi:MAG: ATP-binding SpoIIE family protein phosphatase [Candidatus Tyrphobacter sp.]